MDEIKEQIDQSNEAETKFETCLRGDSDNEVRTLFKSAKKRKDDEMKYRLLSESLQGKSIDLTKCNQLFEAVNREKMSFEQLLKLHPEEAQSHADHIKARREECVNGRYWNKHSKAWWSYEGTVPPCCYFARPDWYWRDKRLLHGFWNSFPAFRMSDKPL
jgi:hypothetical protein